MRWYILACIGVLLLGALTARVWLAPPQAIIISQEPDMSLPPDPSPDPSQAVHVVIDPPEQTLGDALRPGGVHRHLWQYNQ